jgi:hypothetical protein
MITSSYKFKRGASCTTVVRIVVFTATHARNPATGASAAMQSSVALNAKITGTISAAMIASLC